MSLVVKIGGEVISSGEAKLLAQDLRVLVEEGALVAIVHGGGPQATALQKQLDGYRRIIVLLADEEQQSAADRGTSTRVGQQLFHDGLEQRTAIAAQFDTLAGDVLRIGAAVTLQET